MTPEALLEAGLRDGTFPAAQAVVLHNGQAVLDYASGTADGTPITHDTRFDLASLTKPMCTLSLFMRLWGQGKVGPHTLVGEHKMEDLLLHRTGLPSFVPYFADALGAHPELGSEDCPAERRAAVRLGVLARVFVTPSIRPPRSSTAYSDVGFIQLGEELADIAGAPLDEAFDTHVARPLGLGRTRFHRLSKLPGDAGESAPTGRTRPREPAPGQQGMWPEELLPPQPSRPGEVDDDNAFVLDGVAGHAGLFGTARDVALFGQRVLEELDGANRLAPSLLWQMALRKDTQTPDSTRCYGFDTPSAEGSSAGRFIGDAAPGAVGHLGFVGTSLWVDRARKLVVALCTNRTYNGRANVRIRDFRPRFHDAVVESLGLAPAP